MGLIPEIICRRCGFQFSGLRTRCPKCGAPRTNQATRTTPTTSTEAEGSSSFLRTQLNGRWQLIFGGILALAIIIAVIVLVSTNKNSNTPATGTPSQGSALLTSDSGLPTPSPSPVPTPTATAGPTVTSVSITFLDEVKTDMTINTDCQLVAKLYPMDATGTVVWSSSDESIITVDQTGLVKLVSKTLNDKVTITAQVAGAPPATCIVRVGIVRE